MKKAVMYGAGNIGRGFIGQLLSQSGYEVVFIDINSVIIDRLNKDHCYPIRIVADNMFNEVVVKNVRAVNGAELDAVAGEIVDADIMATAVGVNVLPKIAKPIAYGLKKRWESNNFTPLNIIICENLLDANQYLENLVKKELDDKEKEYFDRCVGLVEASIGRMVPVMTPEMQEGNPLRVWVEPYSELPVDKDGFKGEIPKINNMVPFSPFDFYIKRKLFMHNMGHATTAYLGFLNGYKYIWEAVKNPIIKIIVLRALLESAAAMSKEHDVPMYMLVDHAEDLLYRFGNRLLGDTVERVGKDPVRKLSENDRMVGAARLCLKHGIKPVYISLGISAAFMFKPEGDEYAKKVQTTVSKEGIDKALRTFCKVDSKDPICGFVNKFYEMLKNGKKIEEVLEEAEKTKNRMKIN